MMHTGCIAPCLLLNAATALLLLLPQPNVAGRATASPALLLIRVGFVFSNQIGELNEVAPQPLSCRSISDGYWST
jgi:hypothetical protein